MELKLKKDCSNPSPPSSVAAETSGPVSETGDDEDVRVNVFGVSFMKS